MNYLRQSLFGLIVVGLLCSIAMAILAQRHTETINGGRVEVADPAPFERQLQATVIESVNVLAPDGLSFIPGQTVVIDQGRILAVGQAPSMPAGAMRIDGRGAYLIPGLIDGQVDLRQQPNDLLLYLANGITRIRDVSGQPEDLALAAELARGRPGPSLSVVSPPLINEGLIAGLWTSLTGPETNVRHPDQAAAALEAIAAAGYQTARIGEDVGLETYEAVLAAASRKAIPTIGPLPEGAALGRLAASAPSEVERLERLMQALLDEFSRGSTSTDQSAFLAYVEDRADELAVILQARGTAVGTALWFSSSLPRQASDLVELLKSLPLAYANPAMVEGSRYAGVGWLPGMNRFELPRDLDAERRSATVRVWAMRAEAQKILLRAFSARGVPIVAGSRATDELMVPGFSLHDELKTLHESGLTTAEALRAATLAPAAAMGLASGAIEVGRPADLVLLRANPLVDIDNMRSIDVVIRAGRVHDRTALDAMLEAVRQAHAISRRFELTRYQ